jgi:hypothetical protein
VTRAEAHATVRAARVTEVDEDVRGIVIERDGEQVSERWRVYSGGGIAGNSEQWWLRRLGPGGASVIPLGPFSTKRALTRALRAWRRFAL